LKPPCKTCFQRQNHTGHQPLPL